MIQKCNPNKPLLPNSLLVMFHHGPFILSWFLLMLHVVCKLSSADLELGVTDENMWCLSSRLWTPSLNTVFSRATHFSANWLHLSLTRIINVTLDDRSAVEGRLLLLPLGHRTWIIQAEFDPNVSLLWSNFHGYRKHYAS